ncbi:hypothetical protein [Saccharothrix sp.]|uniref:hypothetical protein n=1 Tax=Saccharothrix sp. TaxID=1873460 RepID=UPI002810CF34|nr:hypothetical protein [Saccharothrix sp.]
MPDDVHLALVRSALAGLAFLDHSSDDEVDPDSAVRATEHMAHPPLALPEADRAALVAMIRQVGEEDEWARGVPFTLGLVSEHDIH